MDSDFKPTAASQAHPETMDFLSSAWCNFAVQALEPKLQEGSLVILNNPTPLTSVELRRDKSINMEDADFKSLPPWKSNDVKSWIWMQQAMHPELNYNSCFRKKWFPWKKMPFKILSIKKWIKEIKLKRKEEERLQKAEVHAAISVAGIAAALAAIAAENSKQGNSNSTKDSAVASGAALVAAQCAQMAEARGAKKEQLRTVIGSAMNGTTTASDILTLTAAAATSLRGAAALKARTGCRNRLNGNAPVLPIEENNDDNFDFEKCRSLLAKGAELNLETLDGKFRERTVSIVLNRESKVVLRIRKLNLLNAFASVKESIVLDLHAELYKDSEEGDETDTCYLIVLTTNHGTMKIDMADDYVRYKTWTMTINHMLMLSSSFTRYELQFYKN